MYYVLEMFCYETKPETSQRLKVLKNNLVSQVLSVFFYSQTMWKYSQRSAYTIIIW